LFLEAKTATERVINSDPCKNERLFVMQGLNTIATAFTLSGLTSWNIVLEDLRVPQLIMNCLAFMDRGTRLASTGGQRKLHELLEK